MPGPRHAAASRAKAEDSRVGQTVVDPDLLDRGVVEVLLQRPEPGHRVEHVPGRDPGVHELRQGAPDPALVVRRDDLVDGSTGFGSVTTQIGHANRGPGDLWTTAPCGQSRPARAPVPRAWLDATGVHGSGSAGVGSA